MRYLVFLLLLTATSSVYAAPYGKAHHPSYRVGFSVDQLSAHYHVVKHKRRSFYFDAGVYYERRGDRYVVVRAPVGVRVTRLPPGYISFGMGPYRYFYFAHTFYVKDGDEYEVVEEPEGAEVYLASESSDLMVYPAKGQSQEQRDRDRYECHRWAFNETGFDPSANQPDLTRKPEYNRAMTACLEGRGYVVK